MESLVDQSDEALHEVPEHERALPGLGMDPHDRVLGLELQLRELLAVGLLLDVDAADPPLVGLADVVVEVGVHRPQRGRPAPAAAGGSFS